MNTLAQWKIERVKRDADTMVLTCQRDLRKLAGALEQDKVLLEEMRFDLRNRADLDQAGAIGMATRGDRSLPYEEDLESWTGTEFVWRPGGLGRHGIEKPADRGQYRLWLPPSAMKLYEKVALGKDLGLCIPGTTFIGGGTILVAKWRHRTSKDIDIFRKAPEWEESVEKARIDQWLERINERPLEKKTTGSFSKVEWKEGDTDFGQTPFLRPNAARDPIVGTVLTACTTEEILAGKIAGRAIVPLRDVYDLAVAILKEPRAVDDALEMAYEYPISGKTAIARIPGYCDRLMESGNWRRERTTWIHDAGCPEAWEEGPAIVQATVQKWSAKQERRIARARGQKKGENWW